MRLTKEWGTVVASLMVTCRCGGGCLTTLLAGVNELFYLVECADALALKVLELLNGFAEHSLLKETVDQLLVVFRRVEARKGLHGIDDFPLFLGLLALLLLDLFEIEQPALQHELFPSDPLINPCIV